MTYTHRDDKCPYIDSHGTCIFNVETDVHYNPINLVIITKGANDAQ